MSEAFRQSRLGCMSSVFLIVGWILFFAFISLGINSQARSVMIVAWAIILFAPAAVILSIAGLIFDREKRLSLALLLVSLLSSLLIFSVGG